ncbi:hemerythrin domain-containing protein [Desulfovibrio sp. UCD-KL4C]|uniref:hemerythrin domain-containing protein n=1 Tax=Desulfovibrio sp. UCD-KL4C TaxID=2578120 RepID=UPI0025C33234|nr:hemerythrin domain-containing protein [Desulfovibrio sp. UCD-KL4C]
MSNLWKQDYLLDIDTIDEQHKHFFEMTAQIIRLAEKLRDDNSVEKIIQAVGALRTYAFLHFKTEE